MTAPTTTTRRIGPLTRSALQRLRATRRLATLEARELAALQGDLRKIQARIEALEREAAAARDEAGAMILEDQGAALEPGEQLVGDQVDEAGTWLLIERPAAAAPAQAT